MEIYASLQQGKTYFSITTKEGVTKYLEHRLKDVESGLIVVGRHTTIKTHLQHWLEFIGKDTKLKELERTDCEDYFHERMKRSNGNVKQVTVQNEQSTINACMRWLYRNNETHFETFDFKKLPKIDRNNEVIRRATFTNDEYERIYRAMRTYCAKSNKKADDEERLVREIVRHYILVAANSGSLINLWKQLKLDTYRCDEAAERSRVDWVVEDYKQHKHVLEGLCANLLQDIIYDIYDSPKHVEQLS